MTEWKLIYDKDSDSWEIVSNQAYATEQLAQSVITEISQLKQLKERIEKLLKKYDHDYNDIFHITDDMIKKAQIELGFKQSYDNTHNFAILKVSYTREELQQLLKDSSQ